MFNMGIAAETQERSQARSLTRHRLAVADVRVFYTPATKVDDTLTYMLRKRRIRGAFERIRGALCDDALYKSTFTFTCVEKR